MQALCFSSDQSISEGGGLLSIESHRSVPAPFLTKTYQLVDDPTTDQIVSWGEDESTFVVWRPPEFARDLLPNYFKHNNFSSFVRQLNTYGFRKIVPDRWEFANEFFRKGEKHLLCEIHRRKTAQNNRSSPTNSNEDMMLAQQASAPPWSPHSSPIASPPGAAFSAAAMAHHVSMQQAAAAAAAHNIRQMSSIGTGYGLSLSEENERLRRDNTILLSELSRMRKLYSDVLVYVQHHNFQAQSARATLSSAHSELSTQTSGFHVSNAQKNLIYHPSNACNINGITQRSNMDSPSSRLMAAADSSRTSDNTMRIPFAVPVTSALQLPAMARAESVFQNSHSNVDIRGISSNILTSSCPAQLQNTLTRSCRENGDEDGTACSIAAAESEKSPPKLFGVPLQLTKKRALEENNACNQGELVDDGLSFRSSEAGVNMLKSVKTSELALELKQPMSSTSMHAPWLKFNASRDERVYN